MLQIFLLAPPEQLPWPILELLFRKRKKLFQKPVFMICRFRHAVQLFWPQHAVNMFLVSFPISYAALWQACRTRPHKNPLNMKHVQVKIFTVSMTRCLFFSSTKQNQTTKNSMLPHWEGFLNTDLPEERCWHLFFKIWKI